MAFTPGPAPAGPLHGAGLMDAVGIFACPSFSGRGERLAGTRGWHRAVWQAGAGGGSDGRTDGRKKDTQPQRSFIVALARRKSSDES